MAGVSISISIDIEIFRKISIDIDRNIRIPHRNSTNFWVHCRLYFRSPFTSLNGNERQADQKSTYFNWNLINTFKCEFTAKIKTTHKIVSNRTMTPIRHTVTMPPKMADRAAHWACVHAYTITCYSLYGCFRQLPPSCLLAQWESSRMLHFRFAVRSNCWVIFLKFCSVSVRFLYNFSIAISHLISLTSTYAIIHVCWWSNVLFLCER